MRASCQILSLLTALVTAGGVQGETLRIAVAANFKPALESISAPFERDTGIRVTLSSASTGVLAAQITHGAPFDLFFAADRDTPMSLARASGDAFCYALGRLALAGGTPRDLARPGITIAIANPVTAPYGRAAMQVLQGRAPAAGQTILRGNNAAQAYQFWHSGGADLAIVPLSIAPAGSALVPADWYAEIAQYAVVLKRGDAVSRYLNWFESATVRSLITDAGYATCP